MVSLRKNLEWLGAVAVVASLLTVAYEIRQTTNAMAAQSIFELNEAGRQTLLILSTDANLSGLVTLGRSAPDALTGEQWTMYLFYEKSMLNIYESAWIYHERGVISDDEWEGWRLDYCDKISLPGFSRAAKTLISQSSKFWRDVVHWCQ